MAKSEAEVALEIYQSVEQSSRKQRRLKSSTFWKQFRVKSRHQVVVDRVVQLLEEQGLKVSVKSGVPFGKEEDSDWIVLTLKLYQPPDDVSFTQWPTPEWFELIAARSFESEREVEAFFICPVLEELGYAYDDIAIGFPVRMFRGVQRTTAEADFVIFKGPGREVKNALLLIEAKRSTKGITVEHVGQARSYAQELLPAYYVVTNGEQIKVYQFNGMLAPDDCVMDFSRSTLREKWQQFYSYVSREATVKRKEWLVSKLV